MTVAASTEGFYRLSSRCDLSMTEEQQAAKYISGLKYNIQKRVIIHDVFSVDEVHNKALKIERLHNRAPLFRCPTPIEESTSGAGVQLASTTVDHQSTNVLTSEPTTSTATTAKSKENPYIKPRVGKCYRCGKPGHKSNECRKRKHVNLADYKNDGEEEVEIQDLDESDLRKATRLGSLYCPEIAMQSEGP